jgi:hypothetical protein
MKIKLLFISILFTGFFQLQAQTKVQDTVMKITFTQFEEWMKTLSPAGYPFTETGKNGGEYLATFMNKETFKMIGITMSPLKNFDDYKKFKSKSEPYVRNGMRHVYYGIENFWNLTVEVKELNACFQVTTVYINLKKEEIEKILDETGVYKRKP